ncbi:MAG: NYN domain-containing protein [Candidatus Zambryskibacteria bacterium]|nr:NYN domain-containing protein [Candidatus Zambryskibacteria bacterium]
MDLADLKKQFLLDELGIESSFGKMLVIIDFGNVDYWFEEDRQDAENQALAENEKLVIDLDRLKEFCSIFSDSPRFYYGHDPAYLGFLQATRHVFGKSRVITKPIQKVRHYLSKEEESINTRDKFTDITGNYVFLPKCNFDVEMTVDSIRLIDEYDALVLFSGDADFISLNRYLRKKGKKIILVKGGNITSELRGSVDKVINAQNIKRHITKKKQKPGN